MIYFFVLDYFIKYQFLVYKMLTGWKLKDKLHKELMRSIQKTPYVTISVEHIKEVLQIFPLVRKASTEFLIFFTLICGTYINSNEICFHNLTVSLIHVMSLNIHPNRHLLVHSQK